MLLLLNQPIECKVTGSFCRFEAFGNRQRKNVLSSSNAHSKQERGGKGAAGKPSVVYRVGELVKLIGFYL